jgi:hypothetical protein
MNSYAGMRSNNGDPVVLMNGLILDPKRSQRVINHSPDGFEWGYGGSGPSQLALAILLEEVDQEMALELYQEFKWRVIAILGHEWRLDSITIMNVIGEMQRSRSDHA